MGSKHNFLKQLTKFALKKHPLEPGGVRMLSTCVLKNSVLSTRLNCLFDEHSIRCLSLNKPYLLAAENNTSYDRNYITEERALKEFLLDIQDLHGLRVTVRRSANEIDPPHKVYWRRDIEARAVQRWGSLEKVQLEREV